MEQFYLIQKRLIVLLRRFDCHGKGLNFIFVGRDVFVQDLRLQEGGLSHLVPVGKDLGEVVDHRLALLAQEIHQHPDRLLHLDLLQDVELLVVVGEGAGGSISVAD